MIANHKILCYVAKQHVNRVFLKNTIFYLPFPLKLRIEGRSKELNHAPIPLFLCHTMYRKGPKSAETLEGPFLPMFITRGPILGLHVTLKDP